jgi:hypothetical protein
VFKRWNFTNISYQCRVFTVAGSWKSISTSGLSDNVGNMFIDIRDPNNVGRALDIFDISTGSTVVNGSLFVLSTSGFPADFRWIGA